MPEQGRHYKGFDIETRPSAAGPTWDAWLAGHPGHHCSGRTEDEAIGGLVRRLNVQAGGLPAEARRVAVSRDDAALIDGAFLPFNPNKCRRAAPEVIAAVRRFKAALKEPSDAG